MEKQQQKKVHSQQTNSVIRTLRLLEVLRESTDENHPLRTGNSTEVSENTSVL